MKAVNILPLSSDRAILLTLFTGFSLLLNLLGGMEYMLSFFLAYLIGHIFLSLIYRNQNQNRKGGVS